MNKYAVTITFYRKRGKEYHNTIIMGFVVSEMPESAVKEFMKSELCVGSILDGYKKALDIAVQVPEEHLNNLLKNNGTN